MLMFWALASPVPTAVRTPVGVTARPAPQPAGVSDRPKAPDEPLSGPRPAGGRRPKDAMWDCSTETVGRRKGTFKPHREGELNCLLPAKTYQGRISVAVAQAHVFDHAFMPSHPASQSLGRAADVAGYGNKSGPLRFVLPTLFFHQPHSPFDDFGEKV